MGQTSEQVRDALSSCRVLVVEDDRLLAERIAGLFSGVSDLEPALAHCMEQARKFVDSDPGAYHLAIVDVMLPETHEDNKQILELEQILDSARRTIEQVGTFPLGEHARMTLDEARYKRAQALRQIQSLIDRDGGIKLVEEWYKVHSSHGQLFPILYLTAVGNPTSIHRGLLAAKNRSDWVVKPAPSDMILEKCAELLQNEGSSNGS